MVGIIKPLIKYVLSFSNFNCGDGIDKILEYILNSSDDDALQKFKQQLSKQTLKLKNERLVLIIDELDRCNPNFSIRLLEILKHMFNIDGLFVILVLNNNFFNQSLKSVYGATFDNNSEERYLDKFTNFRIPMYTPDASEYEKIISVFLEKEENKDDLSGLLKRVDSSYSLSEIFSQYKISLRQTKIACETACKYIDDRRERGIPSELFLHLICRNFSNKNSKNISHEYQKNNEQKRNAIWSEFSKIVIGGVDAAVELSIIYGVYSVMSLRLNDYQWIVGHAIDFFVFLHKCSTEEAAKFAESYISELFAEIETVLGKTGY
jgi:hypothetical protein